MISKTHLKVAVTVKTNRMLAHNVTQSKYSMFFLVETPSFLELDVINIPAIWKTLAQLLADEIKSQYPPHTFVSGGGGS